VPADSLRALIALHRGDVLSAESHVAAAEQAVAAGAPQHAIDLMVLARARVLEAGGKVEEALQAVAEAFAMAMEAGAATYAPVLAPELARLAALTSGPARAAETVPVLDRIAGHNPGVLSLRAAALQSQGWVGADPEPLVQAARLMRDTGRVLEAARAARDAAVALGPQQAGAARDLLEEARVTYERCGAGYDLARVESALRGLGARRGVRGRRQRPRTGWESLTDTELRVVRLVAERLTNPEIAERLFISRRTVQTHVSHALAKVGVASRRELAAEAARRAGWRIRFEGGAQDGERASGASSFIGSGSKVRNDEGQTLGGQP
jgi:DNA-binding CsgD family transcriptional regulator